MRPAIALRPPERIGAILGYVPTHGIKRRRADLDEGLAGVASDHVHVARLRVDRCEISALGTARQPCHVDLVRRHAPRGVARRTLDRELVRRRRQLHREIALCGNVDDVEAWHRDDRVTRERVRLAVDFRPLRRVRDVRHLAHVALVVSRHDELLRIRGPADLRPARLRALQLAGARLIETV